MTILKITPHFVISILFDAFKFCLHKQERLLSEVKLQGLHKFDKTLKLKSDYEKIDRRFDRNSHHPIQYDHFVCSLTRFVCTLYICRTPCVRIETRDFCLPFFCGLLVK